MCKFYKSRQIIFLKNSTNSPQNQVLSKLGSVCFPSSLFPVHDFCEIAAFAIPVLYIFWIVFRYERMMNEKARTPDWKIVCALVSRALVLLGSSVSPIIYAFAGEKFRRYFMEMMRVVRAKIGQCFPRGQQSIQGVRAVFASHFSMSRTKSSSVVSLFFLNLS